MMGMTSDIVIATRPPHGAHGLGRMPGRRRSAATQVVKSLLVRAGQEGQVVSESHMPWMSATFAGMRHEVALDMPPAAIGAFCRGIGAAEFQLRDHLLADIVAHPCGGTVFVEALTISEVA